jgi:hypothetical protein
MVSIEVGLLVLYDGSLDDLACVQLGSYVSPTFVNRAFHLKRNASVYMQDNPPSHTSKFTKNFSEKN